MNWFRQYNTGWSIWSDSLVGLTLTWDVPSCPLAQPVLPISRQLKQNQVEQPKSKSTQPSCPTRWNSLYIPVCPAVSCRCGRWLPWGWPRCRGRRRSPAAPSCQSPRGRGTTSRSWTWSPQIILGLKNTTFKLIAKQWKKEQVWPFVGCCTAYSQTDAGIHQLYNNSSLVLFSTVCSLLYCKAKLSWWRSKSTIFGLWCPFQSTYLVFVAEGLKGECI